MASIAVHSEIRDDNVTPGVFHPVEDVFRSEDTYKLARIDGGTVINALEVPVHDVVIMEVFHSRQY
jgi:hypothetical protein